MKHTAPIPPLPERMWANQRCYFAFPMVEEDLELADFDEWRTIETMIEKAKLGSFGHTQAILGTFDSDDHWVRRGVYVDLIGHAGTEAINERVLRELQGNLPADYCWDFAELLYEWGRLDVVPLLLAGWRAGYRYQDAASMPPRLSTLLEEDAGPICSDFPRPPSRYRAPTSEDDVAADAYFERVTARHAELAERFGEQAFVLRGRLLDPSWIAECGLRDLADDPANFDSGMRQKFEAMTGIDCSAFYEDGDLRPLAAAAIFEAFLASDAPARFPPGKRYFFGHPIPYGDPKGANAWPPY